MGYLTFFINRIALEADTSAVMDFYNSEEHAGTSYLPFVGFMLFLAGIVVIIVGLATYLTAKHNFNIFFDARDVRMTYEEQIMPDDEKARLNNEKLAKASRTAAKKNQHKKTQNFVDSKPAKSKNKVQKKVVEKKLPDNALGNDPKLKAIFEQFKSQ